jgi:hypothetical protein
VYRFFLRKSKSGEGLYLSPLACVPIGIVSVILILRILYLSQLIDPGSFLPQNLSSLPENRRHFQHQRSTHGASIRFFTLFKRVLESDHRWVGSSDKTVASIKNGTKKGFPKEAFLNQMLLKIS